MSRSRWQHPGIYCGQLMSLRSLILFCLTAGLLLAAGCASSRNATGTQTSSKTTNVLLLAKELGQSRQHKKSILLLKKYLVHHPDNVDTLFSIGRAYFAMAEYEQASQYFRHVLAVSPRHIDARHRLWAARLQENYSSKSRRVEIRSEINSMLSHSNSGPEMMLVAYYGYRYLWDQNNQQRIIKILAANPLSKSLRQRVAGALVYEIITAKKPNIRTEMAKLYLHHYAGMSDNNIAASWLFSHSVVKKNLPQLDLQIRIFTGAEENNAEANFYAASALIRNDYKLSTAKSLLRINLALIKKNDLNGQNKILLAKNKLQLGILHYKQKKYHAARKYLTQSQVLQPTNGTPAYYLGKIAENLGHPASAIAHFRKSLETGGRQSRSEAALTRLLEKYLNNESPSKYFARKEGAVVFVDVAHSVGLSNVNSHRVAWGDFDNDGDDDLLVNGNRLFANIEGKFVDVTAAMEIPRIKKATGGIWGDFNNDGYLDIFITVKGRNRLLKNINGTKFIDVSSSTLPKEKALWSEAAAWGDFNGDGYLDLYIANYQLSAVERGICGHDILLENIRGTHFVATNNATLPRPDEAMCGRGVTWVDFNSDSKSDIFVTNYRLDPNFLWLNNANRFTENAVVQNIAGNNDDGYYGNSIGSVSSDFDNNGKIDLFVTNLSHPRDWEFSDQSQLFLQTNSDRLTLTSRSGIGFEETLSDPAVADVDNDGDVDLFLSAIYPSGLSHLYLNDGNGNFRDVSWLSNTRLNNTWGVAFSDYDNDGDIDLVIASKNGLHLMRNDGPGGHWIKISVHSKRCNTYGIGSRIEIRYLNRSQIRIITAGRGTGSQDSLTQLFGLGNYQGPVELNLTDACGHSFQRDFAAVDQHYIVNY